MTDRIPVSEGDNLERIAAALGVPPGAYAYEPGSSGQGFLVPNAPLPKGVDPDRALRDERYRIGDGEDPEEIAAAHGLVDAPAEGDGAQSGWHVEGDEVVADHALPDAPPPPRDEGRNTPEALARAVATAEAALERARQIAGAAQDLAEKANTDDPAELERLQLGAAQARAHVWKIEQAIDAERALLATTKAGL